VAVSSAQATVRRKRSRLERWLPWFAALVLLAGIGTFLIHNVIGTNTAAPSDAPRLGKGPVEQSKTPPTVKVSPAARVVAGKFILTAVARKNLGQAWTLIDEHMKKDCGCTRAEWMTGNINVVPFPAKDIDFAPFKTDWSYPNEVALEVALLSKSKAIKSQIFFIKLNKFGKRWLVDRWAPRGGGVPIPNTVQN
jgi:hypothetical protein